MNMMACRVAKFLFLFTQVRRKEVNAMLAYEVERYLIAGGLSVAQSAEYRTSVSLCKRNCSKALTKECGIELIGHRIKVFKALSRLHEGTLIAATLGMPYSLRR